MNKISHQLTPGIKPNFLGFYILLIHSWIYICKKFFHHFDLTFAHINVISEFARVSVNMYWRISNPQCQWKGFKRKRRNRSGSGLLNFFARWTTCKTCKNMYFNSYEIDVSTNIKWMFFFPVNRLLIPLISMMLFVVHSRTCGFVRMESKG